MLSEIVAFIVYVFNIIYYTVVRMTFLWSPKNTDYDILKVCEF